MMLAPQSEQPLSQPLETLQAGQKLSVDAWVLSILPFKERDKIINLYSPELGKVSTFARSVVGSQKRFAGVMEGFQTVKAHLTVPRGIHSDSERTLWHLDSIQVLEVFPHWRKNYFSIETLFFMARFIADIVPATQPDESLYRTLQIFLSLPGDSRFFKAQSWVRAAFWSRASFCLGFGSLLSGFSESLEKSDPKWIQFWRECFEVGEINFSRFIAGFEKKPIDPLTLSEEAKIYEQWLGQTSIHWPHFENWLQSKSQSGSL